MTKEILTTSELIGSRVRLKSISTAALYHGWSARQEYEVTDIVYRLSDTGDIHPVLKLKGLTTDYGNDMVGFLPKDIRVLEYHHIEEETPTPEPEPIMEDDYVKKVSSIGMIEKNLGISLALYNDFLWGEENGADKARILDLVNSRLIMSGSSCLEDYQKYFIENIYPEETPWEDATDSDIFWWAKLNQIIYCEITDKYPKMVICK